MKPQQWTECPELGDIPHNQIDLTGTTKGKLTVVGYSSGWIARCECGLFEVRSYKTLTTSTAPDSCFQCRFKEEKPLLVEPTITFNHTPNRVGACGKQTFKSEKACKAAINHRLKRGSNCSRLRAYFFRDCRGWHFTSQFSNYKK